jgi:ribosomal protein S18 acetylase RimI-like enzyme
LLDDEVAMLLHRPELVAHPELPGYPSHLHIDLLEHIRGTGVGRQMMEQLLVMLRTHGSPGVHLGVALANKGAQTFYARLGFHELLQRGGELFLGLTLD